MNAPLIIPGANDFSETQHDQSYNPYVYDQGYDFDARHGYDDNYRDDDFYEPQQRKPRKTKKRNGKYRRNTSFRNFDLSSFTYLRYGAK